MVLHAPESFTARKQVSINGTAYEPGDTIPNAVVKEIRNLSSLLSARILVPNIDPSTRRTPLGTPTPTDFSPAQRAAIPDNEE